MIIISAVFFRLFTGNFAKAIALFPFIILSSNTLRLNKTIINHERIHLKQQLELLIFPFYIWYLLEFLIRFLRYRSFRESYEKISFEQEAFAMDEDLDYLNRRRFWAFLSYLKD